MVIGHATGILSATDYVHGLWIAPVVIAVLNMFGSLSGGRLADRVKPNRLLMIFSIASSLVLAGLSFSQSGLMVLLGLGIIGMLYGAIIAAFPSARPA